MTELNFSSYSDFNSKMAQYLTQKSYPKSFQKCKMDAIKYMTKRLSMEKSLDVKQLSYLMWTFREDFERILNDGFLMKKINLDIFKKIILRQYPKLY